MSALATQIVEAMARAGCSIEQAAIVLADIDRQRAEARVLVQLAARSEQATGDIATVKQASPVRSAGAARTARWRARKKASQGITNVTGVTGTGDARVTLRAVEQTKPQGGATAEGPRQRSLTLLRDVTTESPSVTEVTSRRHRRQKEFPPRTPFKKNTSPLTPQPSLEIAAQPHRPNWRHETDPVYREIQAIRGRGSPLDRAGGWEFKRDLIVEAERRIADRERLGTGPPRIAVSGTG